jgi:hypothetical protein
MVQAGVSNIQSHGNGWVVILLDCIRECFIINICNSRKKLKKK